MDIRIGTGYDVHALAPGIPMFLGGITIEHSHGLVGHSDADVLLHAICDALLGALALGDIGTHFPDTSDDFKGIDSKLLLQKTYDLIKLQGFEVINLDSTLILQHPRVKSYIPAMREVIARLVNVSPENVSVKATTTERLGFVGREEGVAAEAVVLLRRSKRD